MSGVLNLVSVGPGFGDLIVPRAEAALKDSDVIVSYELYLRWIMPWIAGKEIHTPPLTQERERARLAIAQARAGRRVALISSGDIGVYAMATIAFEEMREDDTFEVGVIPGVTSANACASLLGAPLSHDFATLSLSDLLCPWDWIERRARHIAQADLACVLYNVQSANRPQGVYRVLDLMLEHKAPPTLCGVVRNAYRPQQQVRIHTLQELVTLPFDMLTTLVIGNRFTQRRRHWIYTPRGYNGWTAPASANGDLANNAVWVFAGTGDGNALATAIAGQGHSVIVSTATQYGGELAAKNCPGVQVWVGRHGVEARRQALVAHNARALVDATHPYATRMSQQLMALSRELRLPYIRYERPSEWRPGLGELCASMEDAAREAVTAGGRIFLATGSKDLATFLRTPGAAGREWYVRVTADPGFVQRAIDLGIPRQRICAMQGPFSQAFNEALWRQWRIDCVVTKDSGDVGGFRQKLAAAKSLGIRLLVVARPAVDYPSRCETFGDVLRQLQGGGIAA